MHILLKILKNWVFQLIRIKIKAAMEMAAILESREKTIMLPEGSRIKDLLSQLENTYGEPMTQLIYGSNRDLLQILMLNGKSIFFLAGVETELKDGDQVFLMPLVAGG